MPFGASSVPTFGVWISSATFPSVSGYLPLVMGMSHRILMPRWRVVAAVRSRLMNTRTFATWMVCGWPTGRVRSAVWSARISGLCALPAPLRVARGRVAMGVKSNICGFLLLGRVLLYHILCRHCNTFSWIRLVPHTPTGSFRSIAPCVHSARTLQCEQYAAMALTGWEGDPVNHIRCSGGHSTHAPWGMLSFVSYSKFPSVRIILPSIVFVLVGVVLVWCMGAFYKAC